MKMLEELETIYSSTNIIDENNFSIFIRFEWRIKMQKHIYYA